jgi:hypothetical protein
MDEYVIAEKILAWKNFGMILRAMQVLLQHN